jgi:hypothetical protein
MGNIIKGDVMFELRYQIRPCSECAKSGHAHCEMKFLQYRQRDNMQELGIQPPIWTEWEDVPTEKQSTKEFNKMFKKGIKE